jgi:hypothetical protein
MKSTLSHCATPVPDNPLGCFPSVDLLKIG